MSPGIIQRGRLRIDYRPIVGRPWTEMDCRDVVRAIYKRGGIDLPANALERADAGVWVRVGSDWTAATQPLDVIASDPHGHGCESHLSVVVRATSPRTVLTSTMLGGVCATRPWALQRVLGVYRYAGGHHG